jgi:histidinol-phosphate aminotransferase
VLVRAGAALGKEGALRVSFGTPEENARFLEVLGGLL